MIPHRLSDQGEALDAKSMHHGEDIVIALLCVSLYNWRNGRSSFKAYPDKVYLELQSAATYRH